MYICFWMLVWVLWGGGGGISGHLWRLEVDIMYPPLLAFETGSSTGPGVHQLLGLATSTLKDLPVCLRAGGHGCMLPYPAFLCMPGIQTQILTLTQQFTCWAMSTGSHYFWVPKPGKESLGVKWGWDQGCFHVDIMANLFSSLGSTNLTLIQAAESSRHLGWGGR